LADRTSAAMRSSVETTVRCSVVVPCEVIATGVSGSRPAAMIAFATSPITLVADSSTRVALPDATAAQSRPPSATLTTRTSRAFAFVSGTPA